MHSEKIKDIAKKHWDEIKNVYKIDGIDEWRGQLKTLAESVGTICGKCHEAKPGCCDLIVTCTMPEALEIILKHHDTIASNWETIANRAKVEMNIVETVADTEYPELNGKPYRDIAKFISLRIAEKYVDANLACTFLANGKCTIYSSRPIPCASHFVADQDEFKPSQCKVIDKEEIICTVNLFDAAKKIHDAYQGMAEAIHLPLYAGKKSRCHDLDIPYPLTGTIYVMVELLHNLFGDTKLEPIHNLMDISRSSFK